MPSKRALRYADLKARTQMTSKVTVYRPSAPVFNATTGMITATKSPDPIYVGTARIRPTTGGQQINVGDGALVLRTTTFSFPEEATEIRVDDLIHVDTCAEDSEMNGQEFRILDVSIGGILDPTRKATTSQVEPNPFHPQT
jgi:hypothetical protein